MFVVAAEDDFEATVASPVAVGDDGPAAVAGAEARVWGLDDDLFEELVSGDVVLFYRDGRYVGVGTVGEPFVDEDGWLADNVWADAAFEHCFTLSSFDAVDLSRAAVHAVFDYSANYYPSTPTRVPDDRVDNSLPAIYEAVRRYAREA